MQQTKGRRLSYYYLKAYVYLVYQISTYYFKPHNALVDDILLKLMLNSFSVKIFLFCFSVFLF